MVRSWTRIGWVDYSPHALKTIGPECCRLRLATGHEEEEEESHDVAGAMHPLQP